MNRSCFNGRVQLGDRLVRVVEDRTEQFLIGPSKFFTLFDRERGCPMFDKSAFVAC